MVFSQGEKGSWGPDVDALFNKYANDLAQQGATSVAAKYIRGNGEDATALRERIASKERSLEAVRAAARAKEQQEQQAAAAAAAHQQQLQQVSETARPPPPTAERIAQPLL